MPPWSEQQQGSSNLLLHQEALSFLLQLLQKMMIMMKDDMPWIHMSLLMAIVLVVLLLPITVMISIRKRGEGDHHVARLYECLLVDRRGDLMNATVISAHTHKGTISQARRLLRSHGVRALVLTRCCEEEEKGHQEEDEQA